MGHGLGATAHSWLGLGRGAHCSRCSGGRLQADGAMQRHAVDEVVDWADDAGGGELRDAAAGRPRPRSFGEAAARLAGEESVVLELRGCPRLTVPLAGGLADRTEDAIRHGFELSRPLRESVPLPWAGRPATELQVRCMHTTHAAHARHVHGASTAHSMARPWRIARRIARRAHCMCSAQVVVHYRAGDLVTSLPGDDGAGLPPRLQQALSLAPPPSGAAPPAFAFDTRAGGRLLLLSYALAALRAIRAALPHGAELRLHLFAEGRAAWFEPLVEQLPGLQLHLTPPDGPPERSLEHLHAFTSADVFLLGGGAFSELAASLGRADAVKLAPANVWQGLPFRVPGERRRACTMYAASCAGGVGGAGRGGAGRESVQEDPPGSSIALCAVSPPPWLLAGAEAVHYPSGVLSAGAAEALRRLHAGRQRASQHAQAATQQASTLPAGPPHSTTERGANWATEL